MQTPWATIPMNPPGLLLLQLGTPDHPDTPSVRKYLAEFLSDPMVVDLPRFYWLPILHGVILRTRPKKSARLYQKIWCDNGLSPLLHHSQTLTAAIAHHFGATLTTRLAMRYGRPDLEETLREFQRLGVERLLVLPLFPHYSGATTGSGIARIFQILSRFIPIPTLRIIPPFHDHPGYIQSLAQRIHTQGASTPERHYLFSFHGLPLGHVRRGDPYPRHCATTAELLAQALSLKKDRWTLAYQSRFGRDEWLSPNTATLLATLPKKGITDLTVVCPGFVADCLETLEEIAISGQKEFIRHGGRTFHFVPCLNDFPPWIAALTRIIEDELKGWMPDSNPTSL
ncbi:MAG: ferrochelatase [Magnetococcales bacterium]|nr:ferrochelatase [Magnetococcales bacterium]